MWHTQQLIPSLHFNTKTYAGNGGSQAITGVGFQPDFTWIKHREDVSNHRLFDAIRGVNKNIKSNDTQGEITASDQLMSFDSDGFTLGADGSVNGTGAAGIVAWNWKANGQGSSNTDGSINTTYTSVNTTAGFSIITYTGTGSAGTIGHGLGVKPDFWQIKARSETRAWYGWHKDLSLGDKITLNESGAKTTDTSLFGTNAPTNQVINLGASVGVNNSGQTFVCYAFAEKTGYSKAGLYTGNDSLDGPFCYTGFKPAFVLIKKKDQTASWFIMDNKRDPHNEMIRDLRPDLTDAENANTTYNDLDFVSNGFKIREDNGDMNASGQDYIYLAFAEAPLVGSNNVPCTAR
tara:strand:+ start:1352 stop:2395 length:1044 start_codon:yes stop_codon:yes gene_type:complete